MSGEDEVRQLSKALAAAAQAGQWSVVRSLEKTLRIAVEKRKRKMTPEHKEANRRANAATRSIEALRSERYSGPVLHAMATDERYGSLRAWCDANDENDSTVSAYLTGRLNIVPRVLEKIRRDFPDLDWQPAPFREPRKRGRKPRSERKA